MKKKMRKNTLKFLYYVAWIVGLIAVGVLIYGIIKALM